MNHGASGAIASKADILTKDGAGALLLFFSSGNRPDSASLRQCLASISGVTISHDPAVNASPAWLELLCEGLTFDLLGLEPSPSLTLPKRLIALGSQSQPINQDCEALALVLGPHLEAGGKAMPILRAWMALGATLAELLPNLQSVQWSHSGAAVSGDVFTRAIDSWLKGGPFPVPSLVRFKNEIDHALLSEGLSFFTGQEIRLEPDLTYQSDDLIRLGTRLIENLIPKGAILTAEAFIGPDGGHLTLEPSRNGKFVRVRHG